MLGELAVPVALGVCARIADPVAVTHEQDQQTPHGGARKGESERVALAPLEVGLGLDPTRQRVLEVAEDQAAAVARDR